jgi:hypothetical protein
MLVIYPAVDRCEEVTVRGVVPLRELFEPAGVAVDLHDCEAALGGLGQVG